MRGERLSWLQQEQSLTATEAEKQILSAALLVDLEFARNGPGVRATMIVTNSAGEQRFKTTAESKSLDAALLAPLIEDALTGLHVAPIASKTDHRLESQRFFREAQLRWSFKERATDRKSVV